LYNLIRNITYLLVLIIGLMPSKQAAAQGYLVHYTKKDGLSNETIYVLHKDKRGILWAATQSGLNYFDGNRWQYFDVLNRGSNQSYNDYIFMGIAEDDDHNIYFSTYSKGIFIYNWQQNAIKHIQVPKQHSKSSHEIFNIGFLKHKLYVLTSTCIELYDTKSNSWQKTLATSENSNSNYSDIMIAGDTVSIVSTEKGVLQYVDNKLLNIIGFKANGVTLQELDKIDGQIFVATTLGIYKNVQNQLVAQKVFLDGKDISSANFLGIGNLPGHNYLLSNAYGKLDIIKVVGNRIYTTRKLDHDNSKAGSYMSTYADKSNNTVVLGLNNGVQIENLNPAKFKFFPLDEKLQASVYCTFKLNDSMVLLGTDKGTILYNLNNLFAAVIDNPKGNGTVFDIQQVAGNVLIFGFSGISCYALGKIGGKVPPILKPYTNLQYRLAAQISKHRWLLSTISAEYNFIVDFGTQRVDTLIKNDYVLLSAVAYDQYLYCAALTKLMCTNLTTKANFEMQFKGQQISALKLATFGDSIIVIASDGIYSIIGNQINKIQTFNETAIDGTFVKGGPIIFSATKVITINGTKQTAYLPTDGFREQEFIAGASDTLNASIIAGQVGGFSLIDTSDRYVKTEKSVVVLNLTLLDSGVYSITSDRSFNYKQNVFQINLATSNYLFADKSIVYYRINGTEWIKLGLKKTLDLVKLASGKYKIEFTLDEQFNSGEIAKIEFEIKPAWYTTWWFYTLSLLCLCGIVFAALRYYYNNQLRTKQLAIEKLEAVENERNRLSADLHDEIGSHISTVQLLAYQMTNDASAEHKSMFKDTVKQLGIKIREIVWVTKSDNDKLDSFIVYIRHYILQQLNLAEIKLDWFAPQHIEAQHIQGSTRRELLFCVKECINNIIKHAKASEVAVTIKLDNNILTIRLQDNGIGLQQAKHDSNGLKILRERVARCKGSLELFEDNGTVVKLAIPLG
jgi:signal transduction histidine kinase